MNNHLQEVTIHMMSLRFLNVTSWTEVTTQILHYLVFKEQNSLREQSLKTK